MINGDRTCDHSCEIASSDPLEGTNVPFQSQNSDDGDEESPVNSHYSSFEDSEFERYCSANSAMGTPSLCGSVGTFQESVELDFSSLGGSGLGDFNSSIESFRLEGEFSRSFQERRLSSSSGSVSFSSHLNENCEGKNSFDEKNAIVGQGVIGVSSKFRLYSDLTNVDDELCILDDGGGIVRRDDHGDLASLQSSVETVSVEQSVNISLVDANIPAIESSALGNLLHKSQSHSEIEFERENCSDEEKTSSRFGHSDGEESMFGYGTDDDQKLEVLNRNNLQLYQEAKGEKGNNFLMSSSIAFGSDDWDDFAQDTKQLDITSMLLGKNEKEVLGSPSQTAPAFPVDGSELGEVVTDASVSRTQVQATVELLHCSKNTLLTPIKTENVVELNHRKDAEDMFMANEETVVLDGLACNLENPVGSDMSSIEHNPISQRPPFKKELSTKEGNLRERTQLISIQDHNNVDDNRVSVGRESDKSTLQLDPPFDPTASQPYSMSTKTTETPGKIFVDEKRFPMKMDQNYTRSLQDFPASLELFQSHQKPVKTDNVELHDFCDDLVHEMEEILLDSTESSRDRFTRSDIPSQANSPLPLRDGGSTASTSATENAYPPNHETHKIDGIEVIGAKQRKGDVSFSERIVGVKEYTVYVIRVQSGNGHWEVERRYRDFCTLYRRLKTLFATQGLVLPSPWFSVERESRKIFGNVSPDVIRERSDLIQDCLRSILSNQFSSSFPNALVWFLTPQKDLGSPRSNTNDPQSSNSGTAYTDSKLVFGKTISLVVEIRPYKSIKQILEAQHFTCAGCHKHFDDGKTLVLELVQTLGWGKPRLCEYSGQLFCPTCHTNEIAVLPARVLHHWDFTLYPVSQMAKSYLDSIHDKPMLCVSAVNPFLFSKVPALHQVTDVRKTIGVMLPYVRCPFRMSIFKGLASRRYLLESSDFFALRDLIDLSKGAFAALPVMVDTVSRKILEHITDQCLICCDAGVPCNARQACNDPSALVFPFQEGEIERCRSCKSVFHKLCFRKIRKCPCGVSLRMDGENDYRVQSEMYSSTLDLFGLKSDSKSTMGFISGLFTKAKHEKLCSKDGDTVISMGSLPSTSL